MKVLMADDHWVFRAGLKHLLKRLDKDVTIVEASSISETIEQVSENPDLDLILLDLVMPDSDYFAGLRELHGRFPKIPVVVLSVIENRSDVIHAIELGAMGYIPKVATGDEILKALKSVLAGDIFIPRSLLDPRDKGYPDAIAPIQSQSNVRDLVDTLTQRQREVFALLAQGKSNPEIAKELGVSAHTVRIHISAILRALGVSNRTQAAVMAASHHTEAQPGGFSRP